MTAALLMTTAFRYLLLGKMSMLQFCMLMVICEHADWDRLTANGMSADLFIKELEPLGLIPDGNPKTRRKYVRRAARGLRDQGWYTWDWNPGDTRPYNVFLPTSAELSLLSIAFRVNVHEEGGVKDTKIPPETVQNVHEQATENVHEKSQQKPIETPVSQGRLFENVHEQTTENVHEAPSWTNAPELSLTDHKDTNRGQEKKKEIAANSITSQAFELEAFVNYAAPEGFRRKSPWATQVLAKYSGLEFKYTFVEYISQAKRSPSRLTWFCEEGYEVEIAARRQTKGSADTPCLVLPANWLDVRQRVVIAEAAVNSPYVANFMHYSQEKFNFPLPARDVALLLQTYSLGEMRAAVLDMEQRLSDPAPKRWKMLMKDAAGEYGSTKVWERITKNSVWRKHKGDSHARTKE